MSDKFTLAKKSLYSKPIGVIITGAGKKSDFTESRSLLLINNIPLFNYQIKILNSLFHSTDTIFVGGYDYDNIKKVLPKNVRSAINEDYETTNTVKSLNIGLDINIADSVLIVHGDLFFKHDLFDHLKNDESSAIYSVNKNKKNEIGVIFNGNKVEHFSYNSKHKWTQVAYLTGKELVMLKELCSKKENHNLNIFEILNTILQNGGNIRAIETETDFFLDIDTIEDFKKIKKYLNKDKKNEDIDSKR